MDARTNNERDWVRQLTGNMRPEMTKDSTKDTSGSNKIAIASPSIVTPKKGKGFMDVAGMTELKQLVNDGFITVLKNPECAKAFGVRPPNMLLYGPSGCGKSFFAEKVADEVGISFIKVVPDDLASHYVHGTQEKIGELFRKAESQAPVIVFFDEFDAMVPQRSDGDTEYQNGETNEFLCMLNNSADRGIYVIAATNHPERIDRAVLRTGRIDEMIYVDMPDAEVRESLFRLSLSKLPSASDIDYSKLASMTSGYNCSDISYIVSTASRKMFNASVKEQGKPYQLITQAVLEEYIMRKSPSVTEKDLKEYERIHYLFAPKEEGCRMPSIGFR